MGKVAIIRTTSTSVNVDDFINGLTDEQKKKRLLYDGTINGKSHERKTCHVG